MLVAGFSLTPAGAPHSNWPGFMPGFFSGAPRTRMQRFELKEDPANAWSVIDTLTGLPTELHGKVLHGLTLEDAQQGLFMANTGILRAIANRRREPKWTKA